MTHQIETNQQKWTERAINLFMIIFQIQSYHRRTRTNDLVTTSWENMSFRRGQSNQHIHKHIKVHQLYTTAKPKFTLICHAELLGPLIYTHSTVYNVTWMQFWSSMHRLWMGCAASWVYALQGLQINEHLNSEFTWLYHWNLSNEGGWGCACILTGDNLNWETLKRNKRKWRN